MQYLGVPRMMEPGDVAEADDKLMVRTAAVRVRARVCVFVVFVVCFRN